MKTLANKTAIITGASSGIGRATALLFAKEGASCVLAGRRIDVLKSLSEDIKNQGGHAVILSGDVVDEHYAKALVDLALSEYGQLDIAFNNAGILGSLAPVNDLSLGQWQETINTNLISCFLGAKYQIPTMKQNGAGAIVFTSSFVGHTTGMVGMSAYAASKAGIIGMTQALAVENAADNIRINEILPGGTDTPMGAVMTSTPEARAYIEGLHSLHRLAQPEEIARSVLYLVSNASSFVTGSAHLVDGGFSVYRG